MNFLEKLDYLMKENDLNKNTLSKACNIPYTTIDGWYKKGYEGLKLTTLRKLADHFGTSLDFWAGDTPIESDTELYFGFPQPSITTDTVSFPVIGEVAAGFDSVAIEELTGDTIDIPQEFLRGRNKEEFFVLQVKGDSMYPMYLPGDRVLVLKQEALDNSGEVAVVMYDGENGTLKKIEYAPGENWLRMVPLNPNYPPRTIYDEDLEQFRVIGIPQLQIRYL